MSAAPIHYFVYYRIAHDRAHAAGEALRAIFTEIEQRCGVSGRLMHRLDEPLLWMEIYDRVCDCAAFEAALQRSLESHRFATLLVPGSGRTVERFATGDGLS